ncbi:phospholipase A1-like isoform X2 [Contarinia nasturtii]|uniref:phospholipase A1-like isoform X2 n=1 Tax=Contarinia nasturtii TaxID=265458 RepID=UPI0012D4BFEF|nr:phospholipase A1-like isoform X2 [Contarinia nasturtii]
MVMFGMRMVHFLLTLLAASVFASTDVIDSIDHFIAVIMAGIQLTAVYTFSLGQSYPPIDQDVTFWCLKPKQTDLKQTFLNDPDIKSKIDFTKPVNFLIHGWMGGLNGGNIYLPPDVRPKNGWMRSTAQSWAKFADCNVCAVDWSRLANYDYSIAAMRHTKMVTDALEYFMQFLIDNEMEITQVSIAGHSLGAQIAGYIGEKFQGDIDSIYGLDPAGPGFTWPFDLGKSTRLDPSDAQYVQCVLTSRGTLGTMKDCGHANFIMNGGYILYCIHAYLNLAKLKSFLGGYIQPGCFSVLCSHSLAHEFFEESLDPSNKFIAEKCSGSFKLFLKRTFLRQSCTDVTDRLGIHSARIPGRFFIKTKSSSPYSLNQKEE